MKSHEVDVIMPFHRTDRFLEKAINSVFESENIDINLILIDDRPIDKAKSIGRYQQYIREKTSGLIGAANSFNIGARFCSSEYVSIVASDDLISPQRFKNKSKRLKKKTQ